MKLLYKKIILTILSTIVFSSCHLNSIKTARVFLENDFRLTKEAINGSFVSSNEMTLPRYGSDLFVYEDATFHLVLKFKDNRKELFDGNYFINLNDDGRSGIGVLWFDEQSLELTFENHYFLIIDLPVWLYDDGDTHTLYFERWEGPR